MEEIIRQRRKDLIKNQTPPEKRVHAIISSWGIPFKAQRIFMNRGHYRFADFHLPKPYKIIIEVDGHSHFTKEGVLSDKERTSQFKLAHPGIKFVRIKNSEAMSENAEEILLYRIACILSKKNVTSKKFREPILSHILKMRARIVAPSLTEKQMAPTALGDAR